MAKDKERLDPELIERVKEAAAAARENVLHKKTFDALVNARPEDLITADSDAEIIKGNARQSGCWTHAPAMVEFFAAADKRLTRVAGYAGLDVKRVTKVHAQLLKGTQLVIIKAASVDDLTAIPVNRYGSSAMFNLITLLGETGLTVQTGYRERYDVAYVPKESPLWPGLVIDLNRVKERRQEPLAKSGGTQPEGTIAGTRQVRSRRRTGEGAAPQEEI